MICFFEIQPYDLALDYENNVWKMFQKSWPHRMQDDSIWSEEKILMQQWCNKQSNQLQSFVFLENCENWVQKQKS